MRSGGYSVKKSLAANQSLLFWVLLICLAAWIIAYLFSIGYPVYGEVSATPIWNQICQLLSNKLLAYSIGLVLMIGGGLLLQRANSELGLIRERTLLPFLLYIFLVSLNPTFLPINATSLGIFCLILAMYELFTSYHAPEWVGKAFNAALLIGIGSLLWVHILWFLPLYWYGMYLFRSLTLRGFLASLLGVFLVYWLLFGWNAVFYDYQSFILPFGSLFSIRIIDFSTWDLWAWIIFAWTLIVTIMASVNILTHEFDDSLRTRQYLLFLILFVFWAIGLLVIYEQSSEEFMEISCIPCSILLSHFFIVRRSKVVFGILLLTMALFMVRFILYVWNFL